MRRLKTPIFQVIYFQTKQQGGIMKTIAIATAAIFTAGFFISCGPTYVRGSEMEELDDYAMSTGLDKRDLEQLFDENIKSFMDSAIVQRWKAAPEPPIVSLFPIANETSEHVRDQLDALLSKMETKLINSGVATVVDHARQGELIAEVKKQQGGAFDEAHSAQVGRQLGAKYFLTGKVHDSAERTDDERRVQYFLFMKVVDVETGVVGWQNEADLTKGLVD
ncbi:MAG: penicillin-binding protein activator LpoB [Proteobacteria bacterium]|nr:penicillin-binding protein activator LpoB [Pseudomonadota bacterium]